MTQVTKRNQKGEFNKLLLEEVKTYRIYIWRELVNVQWGDEFLTFEGMNLRWFEFMVPKLTSSWLTFDIRGSSVKCDRGADPQKSWRLDSNLI